ncbi:flagellar motor protein MotB [Sphingosinicella terrae]|uniref:flagellar motor protein MotB n=1 Tax=Sphingosinicella terrae TaxID=2172047 RepID=UPI000E0DAD16|nr:flagellar motor protein MotB [Sphingosinicella terrae]
MASTPAGGNERPIIIVRKKRKAAAAHHGGHWKVAYADFVTAMMAFFMLLWLISETPEERLHGLAEHFAPAPPTPAASNGAGDAPGAGGRTRRAQSNDPATNGQPAAEAATAGSARGGTADVPDASMRVLAQELRIALDAVPQNEARRDTVRVDPSRNGVRVNIMDSANRSMFRPGTADLNPYARAILAELARKVARSGVQVAVEGHTDGVGGQSDANWRLSGERALAARSAMIASGLPQDRFTEVVALGSSRLVYPDQPERPENRRITIVLLAEPSALPSDVSFRF